MAELSHRALRELIEVYGGADEYFSEMISASALTAGGPFEKYYLDGGPRPERFVYQLCGSNTGSLSKAVEMLDRRQCAGIDINMGCSAPAIVRQGMGAAWLSRPDEAGRLINALRPLTTKRLSVKLRTGGPKDDFEYLLNFCRRLESEGVDMITLHPRATNEKLKRRAKWDYVTKLAAGLSIPVTGNGDIDSYETCLRRAGGQPVSALMLGRLAVREPWIFARIAAGGDFRAPLFVECALMFIEFLVRFQPAEFFESRARRFFKYYCENFTWGTYLFNKIARETTAHGIAKALNSFGGSPDSRSPALA
ncbi:MAG: tRNA-dihydrouridine synthase family protein [Spirochaetaceae bacterium]|jgi:tRNA-dihydrouridine synthase|nr:tRNA-dihydrouridine synthase family protein [Spirochaetaceae bacterium]